MPTSAPGSRAVSPRWWGSETDVEPPSQEEAFAAWRRFLGSLAADGPAVLVVEDLHWADAAMVAFLLDLADEPVARPVLVVVTARPAIAERHPVWLDRASPSSVVQLVSLDDVAIAGLIGATLTGASPELLQTVLERAAGSPLYAEQLAALVRERGLTAADASLDERVIPPTIQALLAARIDALPRDLKPTLLDASVIGKVFWSGAVAALENRERLAIEPALTDLERRELTRSKHPSSMADETEYGFWHALLREVAYSFLPRAARLAKHRAAAAWITAKAGGALGDLAEIVVDHLRRAEELADATGAADELTAIRWTSPMRCSPRQATRAGWNPDERSDISEAPWTCWPRTTPVEGRRLGRSVAPCSSRRTTPRPF